jgi:hypothetical protein
MNRRDDSPGEFHPGNPGFQESIPDQYGQEHYEHRRYGPGQRLQGPSGESQVGFNRGYYEDPLGHASYPQDWYRREAYPRQPYPLSRAVGTPGIPTQRRRYPPGPKGYKRSDERLREDISERLMQAYDIDSSDVTVEVSGGKVVLEGTVPDRYMKHAIEDLSCAAPGVQDVENRIRVGS